MNKKSAKKEMPKMSLEELKRRLAETDLAVFEDEPEENEETKAEPAVAERGIKPQKQVAAVGGR